MIKYLRQSALPGNSVILEKTCRQIKQDFGFLAEPFMLHAPSPEALAAIWILLREATLAGTFDRKYKEVVATAVSESNRCPYCVDAHNIMFRATGDLNTSQLQHHPDPTIRDLYFWGLSSGTPNSKLLKQPPFRREDLPEIYGTGIAFHYINRMVSVFLEDTPLPIRYPKLKKIQQQMVALWLRRVVQRPKAPGDSLQLLAKALKPSNFPWLDTSSNVAEGLGRWIYTLEKIGNQSLTATARECISGYLDCWQGEIPPFGSGWLDQITNELQGEDRVGARLGLLVALCPYRITGKEIENYRKYRPGDNELIGATAWASMKTALQIAKWWCCPE